ncbi:MAG TPA: hypothetical protein PKE29_09875 [Phycisphaerales bacterium]|nr:hypothetical protein [Phycisphaerales bacterium]
MSNWKPFCTAMHLTALGLWAGSVAMAAATAAVAFPTLKALGVELPSVGAAFQPDAYRFAAGAVAASVFFISDVVAFACAMIACVTLLVLMLGGHLGPRRPSTYVRALALGVAVASLAAILFVVTPGISAGAKGHLAAARAGDEKAAAMHKQAVDDLHPISTNLLAAEFASVLVALFLAAWAAGGGGPGEGPPGVSEADGRPAYPEPALRRRGG